MSAVERANAFLKIENADRTAELRPHPLLDQLRDEPRFQAVMRKLKFPD